MPNPKMGTVTKDVAKAVRTARAGAVQFRVEKRGVIQAGIGKLSFGSQMLADNIRSIMISISDLKPENFKGTYLMKCTLSSSMGPGIPVDIQNVDPTNGKFMLSLNEISK
jgi:large subunit ribosomal protein L1